MSKPVACLSAAPLELACVHGQVAPVLSIGVSCMTFELKVIIRVAVVSTSPQGLIIVTVPYGVKLHFGIVM